MRRDSLHLYVATVGAVLCSVYLFLLIGPKECSRRVRSWSASAYGSDWLIVQYAYDGTVIESWELEGKSVNNEENSDGIVFIDNSGNVTHLSGHYVYVQVMGGPEGWAKARDKLITKKPMP